MSPVRDRYFIDPLIPPPPARVAPSLPAKPALPIPPRPTPKPKPALSLNPVACSPTPYRSRHPVVPFSGSLLLSSSFARFPACLRAYNVVLCMYPSVDCSKDDGDSDDDDDDDRVETGAVEYAPVKCVSAYPKLMGTSCRPSAHIPTGYQYHDGYTPDRLERIFNLSQRYSIKFHFHKQSH